RPAGAPEEAAVIDGHVEDSAVVPQVEIEARYAGPARNARYLLVEDLGSGADEDVRSEGIGVDNCGVLREQVVDEPDHRQRAGSEDHDRAQREGVTAPTGEQWNAPETTARAHRPKQASAAYGDREHDE